MNESHKCVEIKRFLNHHSVRVCDLVETKVKSHRKMIIQKKFGNQWRWTDNHSTSPRGRIWIGWLYSEVDITVIQVHEQFIHTSITCKQSQQNLHVTFAYGLHTVEDRREMWSKFQSLTDGLQDAPWIIAGDLNAMLYEDDRINGSAVTTYEMQDFEQFLFHSGSAEVQSTGQVYTWSNKGNGANRICSRLDRVIANSWCLEADLITRVEFLLPGVSDHSPCLISWGNSSQSGGKPFKFFNYLTSHSQFIPIVESVCQEEVNGTAMFRLWEKLKRIKKKLKVLHKEDFAQTR